MGSVPTSLGEWIHSPWFHLGLVVWKGYRPRVRLVLAGGHASAWISPFWRGPAPGAQRYQAVISPISKFWQKESCVSITTESMISIGTHKYTCPHWSSSKD